RRDRQGNKQQEHVGKPTFHGDQLKISRPQRSTRKRPRSPFGFVLALLLSSGLGIGLAQWQPQWFPPLGVNNSAPRGQRFVLDSNVLFLPVTATLREEGLPLLDQIAQQLPPQPNSHIRIISHARTQATAEESLNLPYRRALAVENYLKSKVGKDRYYWFASADASPTNGEDRIEIVISP
ncbi:MAG: OmpA family protein, partial [Pseudanabaenaceae cyanobacterium]